MVELARQAGAIEALENFGGRVTVDTCILASPMLPDNIKRLMTNSAKYAYYSPGLLDTEIAFGSLADITVQVVTLRAAVVPGTVVGDVGGVGEDRVPVGQSAVDRRRG